MYHPDIAIPPGETLREVLEHTGTTTKQLARVISATENEVQRLIQGKCLLTEETSVALEKALKIPSNFWLELEKNYRAALERAGRTQHKGE